MFFSGKMMRFEERLCLVALVVRLRVYVWHKILYQFVRSELRVNTKIDATHEVLKPRIARLRISDYKYISL